MSKSQSNLQIGQDSNLVRALKDYSMKSSDNMQRKMDYFYSPYTIAFNTKKFMQFNGVSNRDDIRGEEPKLISKDKKQLSRKSILAKKVKTERSYTAIENKTSYSTIENRRDLWSNMKNTIFETDKEVFKKVHRNHLLQQKSNDYLTKLDLIDDHPEIYDKKNSIKLTKQEIEQLRCISMKYNGSNERKYGSRSPCLDQMQKRKKVQQNLITTDGSSKIVDLVLIKSITKKFQSKNIPLGKLNLINEAIEAKKEVKKAITSRYMKKFSLKLALRDLKMQREKSSSSCSGSSQSQKSNCRNKNKKQLLRNSSKNILNFIDPQLIPIVKPIDFKKEIKSKEKLHNVYNIMNPPKRSLISPMKTDRVFYYKHENRTENLKSNNASHGSSTKDSTKYQNIHQWSQANFQKKDLTNKKLKNITTDKNTSIKIKKETRNKDLHNQKEIIKQQIFTKTSNQKFDFNQSRNTTTNLYNNTPSIFNHKSKIDHQSINVNTKSLSGLNNNREIDRLRTRYINELYSARQQNESYLCKLPIRGNNSALDKTFIPNNIELYQPIQDKQVNSRFKQHKNNEEISVSQQKQAVKLPTIPKLQGSKRSLRQSPQLLMLNENIYFQNN